MPSVAGLFSALLKPNCKSKSVTCSAPRKETHAPLVAIFLCATFVPILVLNGNNEGEPAGLEADPEN